MTVDTMDDIAADAWTRADTAVAEPHVEQPAAQAPVAMIAVDPTEVVHLVPSSAIQFLDFRLEADAISNVRRRFFEDCATASGDGAALHSVTLEDGILYHPVTLEACDAAMTYAVDGHAALAAFAGQWVPLPVLRLAGRDADGETKFDDGPSNWVRLHIAREQAGPSYRLTLAFDTRLGQAPRDHAMPAPTLDDVAASARFRFASDERHIAGFVTEAWIDDWIGELFAAHAARTRTSEEQDLAASERSLEHLAHYLTLLSVLEAGVKIPDVAFLDAASDRRTRTDVAVDLILDVGHGRTCALLHEVGAAGGRSTVLALRDLAEPGLVHKSVFASTLEFSKPAFGSEALSRWSGRTDAFYWPSLARVGAEATRLAAPKETADGPSGLAGVPSWLWDDEASNDVWRFCRVTDAASPLSGRRGAMLAGPQLAMVSELGELLADTSSRGAATKPRFSRSSLATFYFAELIVQAVAAMNAPTHRMSRLRADRPRRLARLVITAPATLHSDERAILKARAEAAVQMVLPAFAGSGTALSPPEVVLAPDTASAASLAYLHNEIAAKFAGSAADYFDLVGRRRPLFKSGKSVRIACLDIGHRTTSLAVVTFAADGASGIAHAEQIVDGFDLGAADMARGIADRHIFPALAQRLAACRVALPQRMLAALVAGADARFADFAPRFMQEFVRPIGLALLAEHMTTTATADDGEIEQALRYYFTRAVGVSPAVVDELDDIAAEHGADSFSPLDTRIAFFPRELDRTIEAVVAPALASIIRVVSALDCDVVLLAGVAAHLPIVRERLLAALPVRPDRIVALDCPRIAGWGALDQGHDAICDSKFASAIGTQLASAGADGGLPLKAIGDETESGRMFVGLLGADGLLPAAGVLFTLNATGGAVAHASHRERTVAVTTHLPARLGVRRLPIAAWPASPLYLIELVSPDRRARLRGPFKITLEHADARSGRPPGLGIVRVSDADGNPLEPTHVRLRLCTLRPEAALDGGDGNHATDHAGNDT